MAAGVACFSTPSGIFIIFVTLIVFDLLCRHDIVLCSPFRRDDSVLGGLSISVSPESDFLLARACSKNV